MHSPLLLLLMLTHAWFSTAFGSSAYEEGSSFLTNNASIAVIVDRNYMQTRGVKLMEQLRKVLSDAIREHMKSGGLNVRYFGWDSVHLKKDFIAAITLTDCAKTWQFYRKAQARSVLLIAITETKCPRLPANRAIMIPILENQEELPQFILDVKMQSIVNWKNALIFADQSIIKESSLLLDSVMLESSKMDIKPMALYLHLLSEDWGSQKRRANIRKALVNFARTDYRPNQFIVFSKFYEDIVEVAGLLRMFHVFNQWLFFMIGEESRDFSPELHMYNIEEGSNMAFVLNDSSTNCQAILNCTLLETSVAFVTSLSRIFYEEISIYGEISDEEWEAIRLTKEERQNQILHYMKDYLRDNNKCFKCSNWTLHTAITWGISQEHKTNRIMSKRAETQARRFHFNNIGYWSPLLGFETMDFLFPHIEHKFRNITMNVITHHNPPWQILKKDSKGAIISHSGIVMEILKELGRMLNFTYQLNEALTMEEHENMTSDLLGSTTFIVPSQVTQMIEGNQFFLAAVAATIDEPTNKAYNYSIPISIQRYSFISRRPDEVSRIYLFIAPFAPETWAALLIVILAVAPTLYLVNRLLPMQDLKTSGLGSVKNCFWYVYGALLQQGGMYLPKSDSGRIVVGAWWIVVIVLVTTYCGNLVAFLTFPKYEQGIEYLSQLQDHSEIETYGLRNGTLLQKYSMITTRSELRDYINKAVIYNDAASEGIDAVQSGRRINVDWSINLQLIVQERFERDKECNLMLGKEKFLHEQIGLVVPRNSPYLHLINDRIKRLFQMGFIERWHKINLPSMDKCSNKGLPRQIINHKVNLVDMQGCFLILLFGFIFAILIMLLEYWYFRVYMRSSQTEIKEYAA